MAFDLPEILKPTKCDPNLKNFARSGPPTGTGRVQRIYSDAGFWLVAYEILLNTAAKVRAWRATVARLRTGEEVNMPIFERSVPPGGMSVETTAMLGSAAEMRDTEITISATGVDIVDGMYFGIGDRLYMVSSVVSGSGAVNFNPVTGDGPWIDGAVWSDAAPAPVSYVVKVLPPMRDDYGSGTEVKLTGITMLGVIGDLAEGDTSLDLIRHGSVSFTIRESI